MWTAIKPGTIGFSGYRQQLEYQGEVPRLFKELAPKCNASLSGHAIRKSQNPERMVTKSAVNREIQGFLEALEASGFRIEKAYLFGSMYKGNPHVYSDIDLAVWSPDFSSNYFENMEKTASCKRLFKRVELHPFRPEEDAYNNPFVEIIESTGKKVEAGIETI